MDDKAVLVLKKSLSGKVGQSGDHDYYFSFPGGFDFYKDCAKNHPDFAYSINSEGVQTDEAAETYVFCADQHYFFLKTGKNDAAYREMITFFVPDHSYWIVVETPFSETAKYYREYVLKTDRIPWSATVGLTSFEDLKGFYLRTDPDYYRVDEENKTIWLAPMNVDSRMGYSMPKSETPDTGFVRLRVLEDGSGVDIKLMKYVRFDTNEVVYNESEETHEWNSFDH
ncbi:MAG: hypothetical protein IK125_02485 [Lachnospiraceae bacterium]|nr:hypothetical protein [Lachnospiraceae bacterium]